jgi:hypothetical protein
MAGIDRRTFLRRSLLGAAGLAIAGPLGGLACRPSGKPEEVDGYGPLVDKGDLALPRDFEYKVLSRRGDPMSDRQPTPGVFDGMAAFKGPNGTTVLIRNHENRGRSGEIAVVTPDNRRYDPDSGFNGGCTKLVVSPERAVVESFAVIGGTSSNCARGPTPWGSWITCEETFDDGDRPHGYAFEIDARASGPVRAVPITGAGRFVHEAVAWNDGVLYLTEDRADDAAFYRFMPEVQPSRPGDLAKAGGRLQALRIDGSPNADTRSEWPVGQAFKVGWVDLEEVEPKKDTLRNEAHPKGAARFEREEGAWVGDGRIFFDCTDGGRKGLGQIWEYDPAGQKVKLIYESPGKQSLNHPDNLVVTPAGGLLLCEDTESPQFIRGLTAVGEIYDFARALGNDSEFCGATFDPAGRMLFVNQQGDRSEAPGVTYAIWGPWSR